MAEDLDARGRLPKALIRLECRSSLLRALPARVFGDEQEPLLQLLQVKARRYSFTAVTPATHARVLARPWDGRADLRDIFGWSRPFKVVPLMTISFVSWRRRTRW